MTRLLNQIRNQPLMLARQHLSIFKMLEICCVLVWPRHRNIFSQLKQQTNYAPSFVMFYMTWANIYQQHRVGIYVIHGASTLLISTELNFGRFILVSPLSSLTTLWRKGQRKRVWGWSLSNKAVPAVRFIKLIWSIILWNICYCWLWCGRWRGGWIRGVFRMFAAHGMLTNSHRRSTHQFHFEFCLFVCLFMAHDLAWRFISGWKLFVGARSHMRHTIKCWEVNGV